MTGRHVKSIILLQISIGLWIVQGILRTNQQKRYEVDPRSCEPQKKPPTFHNTSCLIGILVMVYYNPYITG